jgi:hypothetical protein
VAKARQAAPVAAPAAQAADKKAKPAKPVKAVKVEKAVKPAKVEKIAKAAKPAKAEKPVKLPREKVVRDSFSMPKSEHAQLKVLRETLAKGGRICTKSELLRAGIQLLLKVPAADAKALVEALPVVPKGKSAK